MKLPPPVHESGAFMLWNGETRDVLRGLPAESVDCVVTSPPYWSLRDYKLPSSVWGGDHECEHEWGAELVEVLQSGNFNEGMNERMGRASGDRKQERMRAKEVSQGQFCFRCGAWHGQLGLEPTPQLYVAHLVEVFREVRRVLAPHGTAWLNLGDSFMRDHRKGQHRAGQSGKQEYVFGANGGRAANGAAIEHTGLKPKDLVMVPHRAAIALQDDGWWVRMDNVWSKPNPMPESVTDRPSKSHEFVFLLSKQESYYFDQEGVRVKPADSTLRDKREARAYGGGIGGGDASAHETGRPVPTPSTGRNLRSVWEIPTQPFSAKWLGFEDEDHFAVFPEELARTCIEASCPRWVCALCGTPRYRLVARRSVSREELPPDHPEYRPQRYDGGKVASDEMPGTGQRFTETRTLGWTECPCQIGLPSDSFAPILSPLGDGEEEDTSMETGRAGMNRPRNEGEGVRVMTRYEQRQYAEQLRHLRSLPEHFQNFALMEAEVGEEAMAHYVRTDAAGARPIPADVLEEWLRQRLLARVELPEVPPGQYRPGRVLDPFMGSGTCAVAAQQLNREVWGSELSPSYVRIAAARAGRWWRRPRAPKRRDLTGQASLLDELETAPAGAGLAGTSEG